MLPTALTITPLHPDEEDAFFRLQQAAFHVSRTLMQQIVKTRGHAPFRLVHWHGELVAAIAVLPMGQWFGGRAVPIHGIGSVAVALPHRGSGVGLTMMQQILHQMHADGIPLSTLHPSSVAFYRRVGYARAGHYLAYQLSLTAIPRLPPDPALAVVPLESPDDKPLRDLYHQQARTLTGHLDRPDWLWRQLRHPLEGDALTECFLIQRDDTPEGYAILTTERGTPVALRVLDMVARTEASAQRLLALLARAGTMAEVVRWHGGLTDPIVSVVRQNLLGVLSHTLTVTQCSEWMLRIVCVEAALQARGYPPGLDSELHLDIQDDLLPANNGRVVLHITDGAGHVQHGGAGTIRLDIRALAALYSGFQAPAELAALGAIHAPATEVARLMAAFAGPRPWMPDMF